MKKIDLTGKVALITGSARGIGRACALSLAEQGADIVLGLRDKTSADSLFEEIKALGRNVLAVQMDIAKLPEIQSAVAEAKAIFGKIDILVNNAGIGAPNKAEDVSEKDFDDTLNVNLKGSFFTSQAVGRLMIEQGRGAIVNLSSQAGFIALPTESIYCMTKAAISHLTKCLALEWAAHGIRVNAVAPTFIKTPGTQKWLGNADFMESVRARIPLGEVGEPEDVAAAVVFLASDAARMITGETLMIDGGWTIQ
jgi:NAD(P)-dependent dehydrogenase (short-subunit alcohol dehydrogenase family)